MIVSFTDRWPDRTLLEHAAHFASSTGSRVLPGEGVALDARAVARVNASRWLADCPQPGCNGAELVNLDDPRFFCCECRNAGFAGLPVTVEVPDPELRGQVEETLLARPVPATRNWTPGETVETLHLENDAHGVAS